MQCYELLKNNVVMGFVIWCVIVVVCEMEYIMWRNENGMRMEWYRGNCEYIEKGYRIKISDFRWNWVYLGDKVSVWFGGVEWCVTTMGVTDNKPQSNNVNQAPPMLSPSAMHSIYIYNYLQC